jgi:Uma2 family endonuclease
VELGLKMRTMESTTPEHQDLLKSVEPDNEYCIQHYDLVADHEVDLAIDPPPDLVVEVEQQHELRWTNRSCPRRTLFCPLAAS